MIIIGHMAIKHKTFYKTPTLESLAKYSEEKDAVLWFDKNNDIGYNLSHYALEHNISYAIKVDNIIDFVIYANLSPTYVIIDKAPQIYQKIAEEYMIDAKVLYEIEEVEEIGDGAKLGIDGVIFSHVLEKD